MLERTLLPLLQLVWPLAAWEIQRRIYYHTTADLAIRACLLLLWATFLLVILSFVFGRRGSRTGQQSRSSGPGDVTLELSAV